MFVVGQAVVDSPVWKKGGGESLKKNWKMNLTSFPFTPLSLVTKQLTISSKHCKC